MRSLNWLLSIAWLAQRLVGPTPPDRPHPANDTLLDVLHAQSLQQPISGLLDWSSVHGSKTWSALVHAAKKGAAAAPKAEQTPEQRAAVAAFEEITESASALMDAGELDIYGGVREALERSAAAFPAEDEDDDMFGDDFGSEQVGACARRLVHAQDQQAAVWPDTGRYTSCIPAYMRARQDRHGMHATLARPAGCDVDGTCHVASS